MSIQTECRDAIYNYVDEETQRNAALTGEHKEYVLLVLQLLRDEYHIQVADGATSFTVPEAIALVLTDECPW
jgi:hypothetical protein